MSNNTGEETVYIDCGTDKVAFPKSVLIHPTKGSDYARQILGDYQDEDTVYCAHTTVDPNDLEIIRDFMVSVKDLDFTIPFPPIDHLEKKAIPEPVMKFVPLVDHPFYGKMPDFKFIDRISHVSDFLGIEELRQVLRLHMYFLIETINSRYCYAHQANPELIKYFAQFAKEAGTEKS